MNHAQNKGKRENQTKTVYYEWLRLIACFLVIFNHLKGYVLYQNATGIKQAGYMVISVITKINVPLFFMISGALLLERQEDMVTVLKKRVSRVCLVILLFSLGLYTECFLYASAQGREYEFTLKRFLYGLFARDLNETGPYWYLYAYLGFLLLLPLMQKLAKQMSRSDFIALVILRFMFLSVIPICNTFLQVAGEEKISISGEFSIPLAMTAAFFYPLAGYYLDHKVDVQDFIGKMKGICVAVIVGIGVTCLCVYLNGAVDETYIPLFDYLLAMVVFLAVKYAATVRFPKLSTGKTAEIACFLGSLTFGIYLLDHYFKLILYNSYEKMAERFMPSLFASFGWCVISMLLGGSVTFLLKRLPLFKRIL